MYFQETDLGLIFYNIFTIYNTIFTLLLVSLEIKGGDGDICRCNCRPYNLGCEDISVKADTVSLDLYEIVV